MTGPVGVLLELAMVAFLAWLLFLVCFRCKARARLEAEILVLRQ
jgi:hypothetical protein